MKITFITTLKAQWGGCEELWVRSAECAIAKGHQVQVVVYKQKDKLHQALEHLKNKTPLFLELDNDIGPKTLMERGLNLIRNKLFPANLRKVSNFSPDCLVVSQAYNYDAAFYPLLYNFLINYKKPYYLISQFNFEHKSLSYPELERARAVFTKASMFFFVSRRNKEVTERQIAYKISNSCYIDNPINIKRPTYLSYVFSDNIIHFASVARLEVDFKGQDILLEVLSKTIWKERTWHLNLYGKGPDEKYLKDLVVYYNLTDRVTFHGHVKDVQEIWRLNHALLMPSISEGKPLAIQEAMICGRIVVASDVAGNGELIDDGINGFIASSYFPSTFSEALDRAWENKHSWQKMGMDAHHKILNKLDLNPQETLITKIEGFLN